MIKVIPALRIPKNPRREISHVLFEDEKTRIEIIVDPKGFSNPPDFWYDQEWDEFVKVRYGEADLLFKDGNQIIKMTRGESIYIPAHLKHRVERTLSTTVWDAIFYKK